MTENKKMDFGICEVCGGKTFMLRGAMFCVSCFKKNLKKARRNFTK